ncbi:spike base protein, RCAP_Rcc01079 family [Devosia sp.]|uniref:spike base protein, RCAP_Rcc01079 family n=1 Tax=Devosia sp. TaxID=1871048 RepID=UPI002AFEDBA0|nr:hypothetical protein [Devosia sp.]
MANRVEAQSVGRMVLVTPSDTTRMEPTVGLAVNADGDVNVQCVGMVAPVVRSVVAGVDYPWRAIAVYATSTTATGIVALYQD